ncbi:hypothetical protein GDO81_018787 [Engystomops pustulosus]|uniref:Uncharacterized protein n=1 Tax=Engystomops pustulosus TaxID=76066 RepID=A0AAV6ZBB6_ENGPU|nr:hypothetical protein GDO81_018787 [Engystomops pustulosus]
MESVSKSYYPGCSGPSGRCWAQDLRVISRYLLLCNRSDCRTGEIVMCLEDRTNILTSGLPHTPIYSIMLSVTTSAAILPSEAAVSTECRVLGHMEGVESKS